MFLHVIRSENHTLTIQRVDRPFTQVAIYAGTDPDAIDRSQPIAQAVHTDTVPLNGFDSTRRYFFAVVEDDQRPVIVAERRLPLAGAINFRDLGGYATTDGFTTKWGQVYRSDGLGRLTPEDITYLERVGIRLICDLRSVGERREYPDLLESAELLHLPMLDIQVDPFKIRDQLTRGDATGLNEALMVDSYKRMLDQFAEKFGDVLRRAADPASLPLVFHCAAGKDRTGLAAMLLLSALDVPRETIMADFDLTNIYVQPRVQAIRQQIEANGIPFEPLIPIFSASRAALQNAMDYLDTHYGGAMPYLREQAKVQDATIAALRANLLVL